MARYFKVVIKNGILTMEDKNKFTNSVKNLSDGSYIMCLIKSIPETHKGFLKMYFTILSEWEDTGYKKEELHEMVKDELFPQLFGNITSTTDLIQEQWTILIKELQNFLIIKFQN